MLSSQIATKRAFQICTTLSVTASIGSFLADFLPNGFYVCKYKKALQMHRFGEEVPLNQSLKKLFNTVLHDLGLDNEKDAEYYEPFTVGGFEVYHAGIPEGKFNAIIGIPINFTYENTQAIDTADIRLGLDRESLNIYHPAASDLLESLVLSDKAKKFAIAREILMTQKDIPVYRAIQSPIIFTASLVAAELVRLQTNLIQKSVPLTIMTYAVSGAMGLMMWFQLRDATYTYFEKQVDKELAKLGKDYIEGGKEYYEKILKRNIALRTLLGAYGVKLYKKDGNEIIGIRQKTTPISYRKKFFEDYTWIATSEHLSE